jgi:hypothetical protein
VVRYSSAASPPTSAKRCPVYRVEAGRTVRGGALWGRVRRGSEPPRPVYRSWIPGRVLENTPADRSYFFVGNVLASAFVRRNPVRQQQGKMMDTPEVFSALRTEIIESQKTQAEFLKWKLIAVSAVGAISLGFTPMETPPANLDRAALLLCAIPLICAYIDFVSLHIMIRIVTIGTYLQKIGSEYERFVFLTRERGANPFIFETTALHGSSTIFNLVLVALGFSEIVTCTEAVNHAYILCGLGGIFVAVASWIFYTRRAQRVRELSLSNRVEAANAH